MAVHGIGKDLFASVLTSQAAVCQMLSVDSCMEILVLWGGNKNVKIKDKNWDSTFPL